MKKWAAGRISELVNEDLCGFVFKSRSPSSGLMGVKIYDSSGIPSSTGVGVFAEAFINHFPIIPVEDDGRLQNTVLRENFIERVFVFRKWKEFEKKGRSVRNLVSFHADHKLLILSHSTTHCRELGSLVANAKKS